MMTLESVYQASYKLKNIIRSTDLINANKLNTNCDLYLKSENLQLTGSFKIRGAYYKMSLLTEEERKKGVVACSAGNHAQGVALAASKNNIKATIFLPSIAPFSKVEATKKFGADVVLVDGVYDDAFNAAMEFQKKTDAIFVHPFDDYDVIAGQGTIALELTQQLENFDAVVVPVGGGGLISGISYVIKKLKPNCKVYGVQAEGAGSMAESFKNNERKPITKVSTFADGIAVKSPGEISYKYCKKYVDEIVTVNDDEIATAILALLEQEKLVSEGAGAVSVAAIMANKLPVEGKKVCAIVSGGNIDVNILSHVITRGLLSTGRLSDIAVQLVDKPGQLKEVSALISDLGANVTRVSHSKSRAHTAVDGCVLKITMETRGQEHIEQIEDAFLKAGYVLL